MSNLNFWKKKDYKNLLISEWFIKFKKKFGKSERNDLDPDPFFPVRIRIRIKIKWILSIDNIQSK